ncbi:MAG: hypothetical protein AVDCRST_MAG05-4801, partial [uncultured Rubrobacteraceae bacterium]
VSTPGPKSSGMLQRRRGGTLDLRACRAVPTHVGRRLALACNVPV